MEELDMRRSHICYNCAGRMYPKIVSRNYNYKGQLIAVDDVEVFVCEECEAEVLEFAEAQRIEGIVIANMKTSND